MWQRHRLLFLPAIALAGCTSLLVSPEPKNVDLPGVNASEVATKPFNYQDYAAVLEQYVNQGVNYQELQANREQLDTFNAALATVDRSNYESWSEAEQIAFWINAYNAFTLQSIIDQEPLPNSIKEIPGVWRQRFKIAGELKTLDDIEHDTLRKHFNEPRIHVALVCAARSCPTLRNEPYRGDKLDAQLDDQARQFIASEGFRLDRENERVYLSSIFKWFGEDWKPSYGVRKFAGNDSEQAVLNFISNYLNADVQEYLARGDYKISYLDYDWSLNQQ